MVRLAPLSVPFERRLQTLAVLAMLLLALASLFVLFICLVSPLTWPLMIPYLTWVWFFDKASSRGGRKFPWLQRMRMWKYYASYYPAHVVKTVDLDPARNYVFAVHPHGIISAGVWANVLGQGNGPQSFEKLFPGIDVRAVTLPINFYVPFWREFVLGMGLVDSSRESVSNLLASKKLSALIVPGGAHEALNAVPESDIILTLQRRQGFVRMALKHGCPVVPVFSFGENEIFDQVSNPKGSRLRRVQDWLYSLVGVAFPLVKGRGVFNYDVGLLPRRHRIDTVIGAPLDLGHIPEPTPEQLGDAHHKYLLHLQALYDAHKADYGYGNRALVFI